MQLPLIHKLEWKGMKATNSLAYYSTELITSVKSFVVEVILNELSKNKGMVIGSIENYNLSKEVSTIKLFYPAN
jgi:hypothetical protein